MKFDWERIKRYEARTEARKQRRDTATNRNEERSAKLATELQAEAVNEIRKMGPFTETIVLRNGKVVVSLNRLTISGCDDLLPHHETLVLQGVHHAIWLMRNKTRYA